MTARTTCRIVILVAIALLLACRDRSLRASPADDLPLALLREHDAGEAALYGAQCLENIPDTGPTFLVCLLLEYHDKHDGDDFVERFHTTPRALAELWSADKEVLGEVRPETSLPALVGSGSLVFELVDALAEIARDKKSSNALRDLFEVDEAADGFYAEYTRDRLLEIFEHRPALLLNSWTIAKPHIGRFRLAGTDFEDRAKSIRRGLLELCKSRRRDDEACEILLDTFAT